MPTIEIPSFEEKRALALIVKETMKELLHNREKAREIMLAAGELVHRQNQIAEKQLELKREIREANNIAFEIGKQLLMR